MLAIINGSVMPSRIPGAPEIMDNREQIGKRVSFI